MAQLRPGRVQAALPVGKRAHHAGAQADFRHYALEWVVGSDFQPMAVGKAVVVQRLVDMHLHQPGCLPRLLSAQLRNGTRTQTRLAIPQVTFCDPGRHERSTDARDFVAAPRTNAAVFHLSCWRAARADQAPDVRGKRTGWSN